MMREQRIPFRILYDGECFICSRTVTGVRKLRQTVAVPGFGVEVDLSVYSENNAHPISSMRDVGLEVTDRTPEAVVMGLDRDITHEKMRIAVEAILNGAVFIGTNPDLLLPTASGFEPGAGATIAAVAAATQVQPSIVGKPQVPMIETALSRLGTNRGSTIMIGDQVSTDIQAGKRAGLATVLVRTGVPMRQDPSLMAPDFIVSSLREIEVSAARAAEVRQRRA